VFISKDSERTFGTYLGAAVEMSAEDLKPEMFKGYDIFHIEGYLVQNHALIERAVEIAKQEGLTISLDLASYNVVESNNEFLHKVVKKYVNILFANEEEAKAFTGKHPEDALIEIAKDVDLAVVKIGSKGSLIKKGEVIERVGIIKVNSVDTTGAGDLYAAGFLYGYAKKLPLSKCGRIGAVLSGKVIEVIGPKMTDDTWKEIKTMVKEIENE
jgi:sugar/nucleoside kinase (ribokinase family)